jgi:hypothetical protein
MVGLTRNVGGSYHRKLNMAREDRQRPSDAAECEGYANSSLRVP